MKLPDVSANRKQLVVQALRELQDDVTPRRPALLDQVPLERMRVPGLELPETAISLDHLLDLLDSPAGWLELPSHRSRLLLFDEKERAVGSVRYVKGEERPYRSFAGGGAEPIAAGLIAVEGFEQQLGREFEARLVSVGDALLRFLLLIPQPPTEGLFFLPLAPSFGRFESDKGPMELEGFRDLILQIKEAAG